MNKEQDNEWTLLREFCDQLQLLTGDDCEASLDMHAWNYCLASYAVRNPIFNRLGLQWRGGHVVFGQDTGFEALERFFGLDRRAADYLFADNPELTGFETVTSFAEAIVRITEIINGEF